MNLLTTCNLWNVLGLVLIQLDKAKVVHDQEECMPRRYATGFGCKDFFLGL